MTGWEEREMKRVKLMFTKEEIEEMQMLMNDNGDTEFIYEVKKLY